MTKLGIAAPSSTAFIKDGDVSRGGDIKLPRGWRRSKVDEAKKVVTVDGVETEISVSYMNGYYATLYASQSASGRPSRIIPGHGGVMVEWGDLQSKLDALDEIIIGAA